MKNIIYHEGTALVTDKETFPTKPTFKCDNDCPCHQLDNDAYELAVADFIRDCTPIRDEDQEKVKGVIMEKLAWRSTHDSKLEVKIIDHTIYKVELEMEEIFQSNFRGIWFTLSKHGIQVKYKENDSEYRRAFTVVETKES